jgi:hypothetical protein
VDAEIHYLIRDIDRHYDAYFDESEGEHHEVLLEIALFPRVIAAVLLLFVCCLCVVAYFDVSEGEHHEVLLVYCLFPCDSLRFLG